MLVRRAELLEWGPQVQRTTTDMQKRMLRGCKGGYFASRFAFLPSLPEISELTLHPLFSTWRRLCWQGNGNERLGLQNIEEKSCFQTRVSVWETWCQAELCTSNLWPLSPRKTSPITGHHPEVSGKSCHIDSIGYDLWYCDIVILCFFFFLRKMSLTFCPGLKYNGEKPSRRLEQPMR